MSFPIAISPIIAPVVNKHWQAFCAHCVEDPSGFSPDILSDPSNSSFLQQLANTWAGSDFAAEQCIKHPELVYQWLSTPDLLSRFDPELHHIQLSEIVADIHSEAELMKALRLYRNREMVRIIWRDLNRTASLQQTTADLSAMADACVDQALHWLYRDCCKGFGTPMGSDPGQEPEPQQMVILGMGKHGAHELNLSSDIDLIFTYPHKGETVGGRRSFDNQEFFTRLGQRLIKVIDSKTADGFVFRVDMRLRPYGSSGALAMSFSAMEQYYQDQGRDWERYAMIKARPVAGDVSAGEQLLQTLKPFTFRRYIDFGAITALRDMKKLIQREVKRKGMETNIKLGHGGIREIEFIAQSFQLIHGGRDRSLQRKALLDVLDVLRTSDYLPEQACLELRDAYIYLRDLEHAIQALKDQQTQNLPDFEEPQNRVAYSMGHPDWVTLIKVLDEHKARVVHHFDHVIADPDEQDDDQPTPSESWKMLWDGELSVDDEISLLETKGFSDVKTVHNRLLALRDGKAITRVRRQSRERLDTFIPILMEQVLTTEAPDVCLLRLVPLVESVLRRTAYLVLLMENPAALDHLCRLCTASPWIAEQITRHPALLDEFLNVGNLYNPPKQAELADELRQQLAHIPEDDLESQMEVLRHFKMAHVLRVAAAQTAGTLPLMKESDYLTWIAEVLLEQVVDIAWRNLIERHGRPANRDGDPCNPGFIVIGYGKLGGIELGPGSDLDLVFVHDGADNKETDGERPLDSGTFFTRLGQRIIHILTTQTTSGSLYEADMRLRPSGSSGLLVSSIAAFEKYQLNDAWIWEHQALVRARAVAGDKHLTARFETLRKKILCQSRDKASLQKEVSDMRIKMREHLGSSKNDADGNPLFHLKHDKGGIVDIEFLMQYAVLAYSHDHPGITRYTDNIRISESLEHSNIISHEQGKQLREAYKFLRKASHSRAFLNERSFIKPDLVEPFRSQVGNLWQEWME
ncbi:bifunctional glutamine-synthetase adenylyltransferase/deadenyltransferase [Endozoicomonas montiporae]|uniref:Bifunctional glutamine synthetase adenylyltransferase/adenylyl-removing enzyme n=2 Tax=Endozoicomonas montiporae TaxID=1027273 RepID=A0A081MZH2_9GAMM|nr:bifunctional [glutamate--ammonia ligase]-adenylyl-L-tyrosine phosphorylase/[glutamate--ammonia-ligase] adenylyltransferase [Endozoicomonas montiporae]KEQ11595.1 bifunctional glutamine-synthetase adenylyltransferase/deadenyltransferase [Endozoicomonas montiporae]